MDFLEKLTREGVIPQKEVEEVRRITREEDKHPETVLVERGISPETILQAKGEYYNVPTRALEEGSVPYETLQYIPEESAQHYQMIPLAVADGALEVGFVDPGNIEARDALQFIAAKNNMPYKIFAITKVAFDNLFESYSGLTGEVSQALGELETELSAEEEKVSKEIESIGEEEEQDGGEKKKIIEDAPVTKIVATILRYSTEGGASDVHIEPLDEQVRVRFRVDGVLHTSLVLPKKVHDAVVARIKILSTMKLDEKRKPQDGRFSAHINGRKIDFRVSTFPTYYGEKVVMRILDPEKGVIGLDKIGLSERNYNLIQDAIKRPYGLILISGPTGSGKTTTLYSMLEEVEREKKNVLSLEDPVEYNVPGISQSQIRPEIGYTFANGLRTTLRQDPDIIMVGEIRDEETAGLAIQAALTGHLVLSTIHTNSAVGVIPRLIDMGVDPYLIAPTLILAIAQRLVKTLCEGAGKPLPIDGSIQMMVENEFKGLPEKTTRDIHIPDHVYEATSTPECPTGTRGRTAVFEVLEMNKRIEKVILEEANDVAIFEEARKDGMLTMREDALLKAFEGTVPFEEVNKL